MRIVVQRVNGSSVSVAGEVVGKIGRGLMLLVGIGTTDTEQKVDWMVNKVLGLRVFSSAETDRWEQSVTDIQGELLVVSQFTLYGNCQKGRRPSFDAAAHPTQAMTLFEGFVEKLRSSGLRVETGQFGAMMQVDISNDGPVTLILEK
jgi:D-tyrosyl-tRNA(Tyr) deacylase